MKKVIRLKDGKIIKINDNIKYDEDTFYSPTLKVWYVSKKDILIESNNIEELIDEFILCVNNGKNNYHYCKSLNAAIRIKRDITYCAYAEKQVSIIGAIWTDKGLIYIAKMNEKGEWELL